jgi:hypothetical protein
VTIKTFMSRDFGDGRDWIFFIWKCGVEIVEQIKMLTDLQKN